MTTRLPSTGRRPSLSPVSQAELVRLYLDPEAPLTVAELAERFECCQATIRTYLRAYVGKLPRGRGAVKNRPLTDSPNLTRVTTEALMGRGRLELARRLHAQGVGVVELARRFGVKRDRLSRALKSQG